jgi:hypothetical protein
VHEAYGRSDPAAERSAEPPFRLPSAHADAPGEVDGAAADGGLSHATCPFLQTEIGGVVGPPVEAPDSANRCVAIGPPIPQAARQQQLVCLTAGHANCPRYLRGALVPREPVVRTPVERGPSTPVVASALLLVVAAAASVGFLLVRGGLSMPLASMPPESVAAVSPGPATGIGAIATPAPTATATPTPTTAATPPPPPVATPEPTAAPTPPPTPAATPRPVASSNRYAVLVPCPNTADCWIYTVRAGDNFQSIVNWFGVPYATVLSMNPGISDPGTIRRGDKIRMPPPTR